MKNKENIFISNPHQQHSHQQALALYESGLLQKYYAGTPVFGKGEKKPWWLPKKFAKKIKNIAIPNKYRNHPIVFKLLLRLPWISLLFSSRYDYNHFIFYLYDYWISKKLKKLNPKVVISYEGSSYYTFKAAKKIGATCILDVHSFHHSILDEVLPSTSSKYHLEINHRKDVEIELSDLIIACSPLAAESYIKQGVHYEKIKPILLGANLPKNKFCNNLNNKNIQFIFAGGIRHLKSIDIILSVFQKIYSEGLHAEILFVGNVAENEWSDKIKQTKNARHIDSVPQSVLYKIMSLSDCLLLPSRLDSFGMVVAESMACGTPVIVSSQVGAKAIIDRFPKSGWIVEPEIDSLYTCIKNRISNRNELLLARNYAYQAAQHFTWKNYRQHINKVVMEFIE